MDEAVAALVYVMLMGATCLYCWFGDRLSQQVRITQTESEGLLYLN
jgi:hypothetical protein